MNMKKMFVNSWPPWNSRQREGIADKPAQLLAFDGDHRNDLRRRVFLEIRQREQQHTLIQLIAEAPQHPFAKPALDMY